MRNQGAVAGDEVGTDVNGRDVQFSVVGDGGVGKAPSCEDRGATGVVEDPERLVSWWKEGLDKG